MTQISMLEVLDATLDAHFPLALPKARRVATPRKSAADVEAPVYLDDFERHEPREPEDYASEVCVPRFGPI